MEIRLERLKFREREADTTDNRGVWTEMAIADPETTLAPPQTQGPWSLGIRVVTLLCLALVTYHFYYLYLGPNFHAIVPGECYRCAQLSSQNLEETVKAHGIRTAEFQHGSVL